MTRKLRDGEAADCGPNCEAADRRVEWRSVRPYKDEHNIAIKLSDYHPLRLVGVLEDQVVSIGVIDHDPYAINTAELGHV